MKILDSFSNKISNTKKVKTAKENVNSKIAKIEEARSNINNQIADIKKVTFKEVIEDILNMVLTSLKHSLNDVVIMPGKNLVEPIVINCCLFFLALMCYGLDLPELLDWRGILVGTLIMSIITYIGTKKGEK